MAREVCQSDQVLKAQPSPCVTCENRSTCLVRHAERLIFDGYKPFVNIRHVITACDGYRNVGDIDPKAAQKAARRMTLSVVPSLSAHGVRHLCKECPDTRECPENEKLEQLKSIAAANGFTVKMTVFCCSTRRFPDLPITIGSR